MPRRERKRMEEECALPMTPMIDVVFQLLIFFLFSIKPEDVIAHLDVLRPQPDPNAPPKLDQVVDMLRIGVFIDGVTLNDKPVSMETMDRLLMKVAEYGSGQTVLIRCAPDSPHERLIKVLDLCAKAKLTNLSVFSM